MESRKYNGEGGTVQVGRVTEGYGGKTGEGSDWPLDRWSRRSSIGQYDGLTARLGNELRKELGGAKYSKE